MSPTSPARKADPVLGGERDDGGMLARQCGKMAEPGTIVRGHLLSASANKSIT